MQIARSRRKAGDDREEVRAALEQALLAARQMDSNQKVVGVVQSCAAAPRRGAPLLPVLSCLCRCPCMRT